MAYNPVMGIRVNNWLTTILALFGLCVYQEHDDDRGVHAVPVGHRDDLPEAEDRAAIVEPAPAMAGAPEQMPVRNGMTCEHSQEYFYPSVYSWVQVPSRALLAA